MQPLAADHPTIEVYGLADAARELGFSPTHITRLIRAGRGTPSVRVAGGPRRMFTREELEHLAAAIGRPLRGEEPTSQAA